MTPNHVAVINRPVGQTDSENVLVTVRTHVVQNKVRVDVHARQRMTQRGISMVGLFNLLQTATAASLQGNGRWRLDGGVDQDGDPAVVIVVFGDVPSTIVVTLLG